LDLKTFISSNAFSPHSMDGEENMAEEDLLEQSGAAPGVHPAKARGFAVNIAKPPA
jgi:hypothetical protein